MRKIDLFSLVGSFAEDKDAAAGLRKEVILPALKAGESIEIDFLGISLTTQSFIHAFISQALRQEGEAVLARIKFKNCGDAAKGIIETVVQYVLESIAEEE